MKCTRVTKLVLVRGIYAGHALAAIIYTSPQLDTVDLIFVSACMFALSAETLFTVRKSSGEWKWFLPSVPIYLTVLLWCVWKLEITLLENRTYLMNINATHDCVISCEGFSDIICPPDINDCPKTEECNQLTTASALIQQTIMLVLICCRWILPKGDMTRDQLSQLLLVFIGMAADMLEFSSESLKLKETACDETLIFFVLTIWSWSLLQFAIGLTATKARKTRVAGTGIGARSKEAVTMVCSCCETEIWAIMTTVVMQDGPYLVMRLYLIIKYTLVDRMMLFFTCKNGLLVLLQTYRLYVVLTTEKEPPKSGDEENANNEKKDETDLGCYAMTVETEKGELNDNSEPIKDS